MGASTIRGTSRSAPRAQRSGGASRSIRTVSCSRPGGRTSRRSCTFDGQQIWKTDTNGSSQVVIRFDDRYIVGGHFRCVGNNVFHPRLVALTLSGARDPGWVDPHHPAIQRSVGPPPERRLALGGRGIHQGRGCLESREPVVQRHETHGRRTVNPVPSGAVLLERRNAGIGEGRASCCVVTPSIVPR